MNLETFELGDVPNWAALVFARVLPTPVEPVKQDKRKHIPTGFVFVIDPKFGNRAQYKMPAGHRKVGENADRTPLDTAVREFAGETGITLPPTSFTYVGKWLGWQKDHWKCLFVATLTPEDRDWMNDLHKENEGEHPEYFSTDQFYACVRSGKFLKEHYQKLDEYALILPMGRDKQTA